MLPGLKTRVSGTTVSEDADSLEQAEAGDDMPVRILNTDRCFQGMERGIRDGDMAQQ